MKFDHVLVFRGLDIPPYSKHEGTLVIWFQLGDNVWLSCNSEWILWEKGRSIGDCLKDPHISGAYK